MENMNVEVNNGGVYINSKPVMEYSFTINDIKIKLPKEEFQELIKQLSSKINEDYNSMIAVEKIYYKRVKRLEELRDKILRLVFGEDFRDGFLIERKCEDFDDKLLDDLLEDYKNVLGLT